MLRSAPLRIANREGRNCYSQTQMHLNVGQKGETSSDPEEVGLAIMDVGGSIFHLR